VIVAKVNNKGTGRFSDDRLLRGAHFQIRVDDGDGDYEPNGDDGTVIFDGIAETGFLTHSEPAVGDYWVVEVDAPTGFERARPTLVQVTEELEFQNCIQVRNDVRCFNDEDQSGGFLLVVVPNTPAELPPTDTSVDRALPDGPRRRRRIR
jgi:hypothetical protein